MKHVRAALVVLTAVSLMAGCPEPTFNEVERDDDDVGNQSDPTQPDPTSQAVPECLGIEKHTEEVIVLGPNKLTTESDIWTNECGFSIIIHYCQVSLPPWDRERASVNFGTVDISRREYPVW